MEGKEGGWGEEGEEKGVVRREEMIGGTGREWREKE